MIEVNNLYKTFVRTAREESKSKLNKLKFRTKKEEFNAVEDISFSIKEGEIVGILGPNGAGKTTLLRMLGGILTPTSGSIKVAGYEYCEDASKAKRQIGYLSGNTKLYGRISPRELITMFGKLYEMDNRDIEKSLDQVIKVMKMESFIDNR
ncbi:MAG: ATP-binding cassette domain-containing protein, partial [Clostridium sp.]